MLSSLTKTQSRGVIIGVVATGLVLSLHLGHALRGAEDLAYDARMRYFNPIAETDRIVHIDLTDQCFDEIAPWPWPRRLTADLILALHELGAEYVAFDIEFKRPHDPRHEVEQGYAWETIYDDDELVAAIREAGNVFIPFSFKTLPPGITLRQTHERAAEIIASDPNITQNEFGRQLGELDRFGTRGLIRFREAQLLRRRFATPREELAAALDVPAEEIDAVWAGVKDTVARELVGNYLTEHPDADFEQLQTDLLAEPSGEPSDAPDPGDVEDLQDALRWYRATQAVLKHTSTRIEAPPGRIPEAIELRPPLESVGLAAAGTGFVAFEGERNVVRTTPLLVRYGDHVIKQLGFAVACRLAEIEDTDIRVTPDGVLEFRDPSAPDRLLRVPLDERGAVPINFSPGRAVAGRSREARWLDSFQHLPASRVMRIPFYRRQIERHDRTWTLANARAIELALTTAAAEAYRQKVAERNRLRREPPSPERDAAWTALEAEITAAEKEARQGIQVNFADIQGLEPQDDAEARDFATIRELHADLVEGRLQTERQRAEAKYRQRIGATLAELGGLINGKTCIVGYTASAIADMKPTPVYDIAPGVMVYSNIVNQVLAGRMPRFAPLWVDLLVLVFCGLSIAAVAASAPAITSALVWLAASLVFAALNVLVYRQSDIFMALIAPLAAMLVSWGAVTAYRQLTEERSRRRFSKALAAYVSPAVARRLSQQVAKLDMSPVAREVTCFFSDLKGFTTLSERLGAGRTKAVLNPYLEAMSDVLHRHDAMINKFMGDGIFAFFNAPIFACPNHAERACQAALAAFDALEELKAHPPAGAPAEEMRLLSMRVGLATGTVFVGDYGSDTKLDYTAIGDSVNLAARLEPANKVFGTRIALPESTRSLAGDRFTFRRLGLIQVVGKTEGVPVYELLGPAGQVAEQHRKHAEAFEQAVEDFENREFAAARSGFEHCRALRPDDVCAERYLQMIAELKAHPPGDDWLPVIELTQK
ncbi:MAG: CHASE2 domain-containing protein [Phycisphaerales bacterium]|nr:MAG: CHASE2 domain-containing protein [Phycisphaerales bacterium]